MNHEAELVSYPPAQVGLPVRVALSDLGGWAPWLPRLLTGDLVKLATAGLAVSLAALVWRRGTDQRFVVAIRTLGRRALGPAGAALVASALVLFGGAALLRQHLVVHGDYEAPADALDDRATWEREVLPRATAFSLAGGQVESEVDPRARLVRSKLRLDGLRVDGAALSAELPPAVSVTAARVKRGAPRSRSHWRRSPG